MGIVQQEALTRGYSREDRLKLRAFGQMIRSMRMQEGLKETIRSMARQLEISPSTLSLIEAGHVMPSERTLRTMGRVFAFDVDKCKRKHLPERVSKRGRPVGSASGSDADHWPLGREIFGGILTKMMVTSRLNKVDLAVKAKVSIYYIKGLLKGRQPVPPNQLCRRLAGACGASPLRLLLLRMISCADPEIRQGLMVMFFPKWGPEREKKSLLGDRMLDLIGWQGSDR